MTKDISMTMYILITAGVWGGGGKRCGCNRKQHLAADSSLKSQVGGENSTGPPQSVREDSRVSKAALTLQVTGAAAAAEPAVVSCN